jgi:hypothetical protein
MPTIDAVEGDARAIFAHPLAALGRLRVYRLDTLRLRLGLETHMVNAQMVVEEVMRFKTLEHARYVLTRLAEMLGPLAVYNESADTITVPPTPTPDTPDAERGRTPVDPIHPAHYKSHPSGVECIDIIEHWSFNLGTVMKYVWRAGQKGPTLEDLRKAQWYLSREIERLTQEATANHAKYRV